jgi:two-component system, chemotaxis family, chemotaxis protein CheY
MDLAKARVLIVGAKGFAGAMLRTVLTAGGVHRIVLIDQPRRALDLLCDEPFDAVFVEIPTLRDDTPFALAARRNPMLLNPMIPIFAVYNRARRRDVEKSRDQGVTDVICRPISPKTIIEKLKAALMAPRPFIAAPGFFGPDRRAKDRSWRGQDRRILKPKKTRLRVESEELDAPPAADG